MHNAYYSLLGTLVNTGTLTHRSKVQTSDHCTNNIQEVVEKKIQTQEKVERLGLLNNASSPKCTFSALTGGGKVVNRYSESRFLHSYSMSAYSFWGTQLLLSPLHLTESPCICLNNKPDCTQNNYSL